MGNKHVISDLYQMQSLSLNAKVRMTQRRIREWVDEYGEDGVYTNTLKQVLCLNFVAKYLENRKKF